MHFYNEKIVKIADRCGFALRPSTYGGNFLTNRLMRALGIFV